LLAKVKASTPDLISEESAPLPNVPDSAVYPLVIGPSHSEAAGEDVHGATAVSAQSLKAFLRQQEQAYLNRVLEQCSGSKEQAALVLGVSLATLYRKLSGEEKD
jgi:DNA-binding NtrC family response regulator